MIILSKIKFFPNIDPKRMALFAGRFWTLGLVLSITSISMTLLETKKDEESLRTLKNLSLSDDQAKKEYNDKRKALAKKRFDNTLNLVKNFSDIMNASTVGQISPKLGLHFKEWQISLGGLTSALITCYQQFPAAKK